MDPYAAIRSCIDTEGRITLYPAKRRKKLLVLAYLAERIPPDREYTEREFSEMLDTLHTFHDPATLRREFLTVFSSTGAPTGSTTAGGTCCPMRRRCRRSTACEARRHVLR